MQTEHLSALCDPRFWVSVAAAFITFLAVLVALCMKELRAWLFPPKLELELLEEHGSAVPVALIAPEGTTRTEESRWFHLKVRNPGRKVDSVSGVTVRILLLETRGADGNYHERWRGDIPLLWQYQITGDLESRKPQSRVVGTDGIVDLCSATRDKWLQLHLTTWPVGFVQRYRVETDMPVDFLVTVQAKGNEADSAPLRLRIFWDGQWEGGEKEMQKHFHVTKYR